MKRTRTDRKRRGDKKGLAVIELAICLPMIVLIVMGAIESASMMFLRQALVQSAYETVKTAVRTNRTQADALDRGEDILAFREISGETITFSPGQVDDLDRGTPVTVTVTANSNGNTVFPFGPFANQTVSVEATMLKE